MNPYNIKVIEGPTLNGTIPGQSAPTVVGAITVRALIEKSETPIHNADRNEGYQRSLQPKRVNDIVTKIRAKTVNLPTAILVSIRENVDKVLSGGASNLTLDISSTEKIYIVDGQHRCAALKKLLEDEHIPPTYKIPFVGMIGASIDMEMHEFYVVNSTSNKVDTSLALKLLRNIARSDESGRIMEELIKQDKDWKVKGQDLLEALNNVSPIWRGKIRLANAPKGETTIPSTSMVTSFEKIFKGSPLFNSIEDYTRQAQVLDAYWQGAKDVIPEAFSSPDKYSLQKGVGVRAMHGIFPNVLERVRGKGSIFNCDLYAEALSIPLNELTGDNGHGEQVSGFDFWITGKNGAAATYSSGVGIRTLIDKMAKLLPPLEVE